MTADTLEVPAGRLLYEADEHRWIAAQIDALGTGRLDRLDRATLIEYLTEMTVRDRRELRSRLTVLLQHLLKLRVQPEKLSRSWVSTIIVQQREIRSLIDSIPSLAQPAGEMVALAYPDAIRAASRETGVAVTGFPPQSPWTLAEALAFDPPEPARPRK